MQFNSTNIDSDKIRMPFNLAMTVGRDLQSPEKKFSKYELFGEFISV